MEKTEAVQMEKDRILRGHGKGKRHKGAAWGTKRSRRAWLDSLAFLILVTFTSSKNAWHTTS